MKQPNRLVRFGFSIIALLMMVGLVYAGADTAEPEPASIAGLLSD